MVVGVVGGVTVVVWAGAVVVPGEVGAVPVVPAEKVEPMSPNLMLEKMTDALGLLDSTSVGTPEVVAQGPREIPGLEASASVG